MSPKYLTPMSFMLSIGLNSIHILCKEIATVDEFILTFAFKTIFDIYVFISSRCFTTELLLHMDGFPRYWTLLRCWLSGSPHRSQWKTAPFPRYGNPESSETQKEFGGSSRNSTSKVSSQTHRKPLPHKFPERNASNLDTTAISLGILNFVGFTL